MDLASFRKGRDLSQQQVADALGIRSKSYISALETGAETASLRLALQIEDWSEGKVPAETLLDPADRELLRANRGRSVQAEACA